MYCVYRDFSIDYVKLIDLTFLIVANLINNYHVLTKMNIMYKVLKTFYIINSLHA